MCSALRKSLGLTHAKNVKETEGQLEKIIPAKWKTHAHHWLILHGRYVCKARKPECARCIIRKWGEYPDKSPSPFGRGPG